MKKNSLWLLVFSLMICVLTLAHSVYVDRPLFHDGAFWFMGILGSLSPSYDGSYRRYADILWQLPAITYLKWTSPKNIHEGLKILSSFYSFHPILGLVGCFSILKSRGRLDLMLFPILSLALAVLPTLGFAVGVVSGSVTFFWPLCFLVTLRRRESVLDVALIMVLSLLLAFSYEAGVILFLLLTLWVGMQIREFKGPRRQQIFDLVTFATLCIGTIWLIDRLIGPSAGTQVYFWSSVKSDWGFTSYFNIGVALLFSITYIFADRIKIALQGFTIIFAVGSAILVGSAVYFYSHRFDQMLSPWGSFNARVLTIPIVFCLAFAMLARRDARASVANPSQLPQALFMRIAAICLIFSSLYYWGTNVAWGRAMTGIKREFLSPGCRVKPWDQLEYAWALDGWPLQDLSILLQAPHPIQTIIFAKPIIDSNFLNTSDPCSVMQTGSIPEIGGYRRGTDQLPGLDFSYFASHHVLDSTNLASEEAVERKAQYLEFDRPGIVHYTISTVKGLYQMTATARGEEAANVWPTLQVSVDSRVLQEISVNAGSWTNFSAQLPLEAGRHDLTIKFTNDYCNPKKHEDRNLFVKSIRLDLTRF